MLWAESWGPTSIEEVKVMERLLLGIILQLIPHWPAGLGKNFLMNWNNNRENIEMGQDQFLGGDRDIKIRLI